MSLSAARMAVRSAQSSLESRRYDSASEALDRALGLIAGLPVDQTAEINAEIAALRAAVDEAQAGENADRMINAAKMQLRRVERELESGYDADYVLTSTLPKAEEYLADVPDRFKTDIVAQIAALRAQLGASAPAPVIPEPDPVIPEPDPVPIAVAVPVPVQEESPAPAAAVVAEPSEEDRANITQARYKIRNAKSDIESRRPDVAERSLLAAEEFLADVAAEHCDSMLEEIRELRAEAARAIAAEKAERIEDELNRHLRMGEGEWDGVPADRQLEALNHVTHRLTEEDVRTYLSAERIAEIEARVATAAANRLAGLKARGLEKALPVLAELEERVANDPFAGLGESSAYNVSGELQSLRSRVYARLFEGASDWNATTAAGDPDIEAIDARIAVVDRKIDSASGAWGTAVQVAKVESRWSLVEQRIEGWAGDVPEFDENFPFNTPGGMQKTVNARSEAEWFLANESMLEVREQYPDHPAVVAAFAEAERIREAAIAHLADAYHKALDVAESQHTPVLERDRGAPAVFKNLAEDVFRDTEHHSSVVTRAQALVERFEAEYAAIIQARQDLWDRLMVDGDTTWQSIVESTGADASLEPTSDDAVGKTVLLRDVYNRARWEWGGFDFAIDREGTPIGGDYESNVRAALEHAWYELKFTHAGSNDGPAVTDHIPWDVIAVVKGPGKFKERRTITRRDNYGSVIDTFEEWVPVTGIQLRIIGLHAGPVAVGPAHDWAPSA